MEENATRDALAEAKRRRDARTEERRVYARQRAELTGEPYEEPRPVPDAMLDAAARDEFEQLQALQVSADYVNTPQYADAKAREEAARGYLEANRHLEIMRQNAGLDPDPQYAAAEEQLAQAQRDMAYDPDPEREGRFRKYLGL